MICRHVNIGGRAAIVCMREGKIKKCHACSQPGKFLCDYPVDRTGQTCDQPMCNGHRIPISEDRDYCPDHYKESLTDEQRATPR